MCHEWKKDRRTGEIENLENVSQENSCRKVEV